MHPDMLYAEEAEATFCIEWVAEAESIIRAGTRRGGPDPQDTAYLNRALEHRRRAFDATLHC